MELLENIFSQGMVQRLGWTLVHFIWQASMVALFLAILLKLLHKSSASLRYIVACLALVIMVLLPAITMNLIPVAKSYSPIETTPESASMAIISTSDELEIPANIETLVIEAEIPVQSIVASVEIPFSQRITKFLEPILPYVVIGWLAGVFGLSLWYLGGWAQLQRLRQKMVKPVEESLQRKLKELQAILGVSRAVQLVESALVQTPTVVGWLKPVILLPASVITGFSTEQIEAILAHELAHIKRCDYLVNMLQTAVEILGFYHPAVWWISKKIRVERENCCDDIAVKISGDRIGYAKTLALFDGIRVGQSELAVAASGGSLFERICRLVGKDTTNEAKPSWLPSVIVMLLVCSLLIPVGLAMSDNSNVETPDSLEAVFFKTFRQNREALKSASLAWTHTNINPNVAKAGIDKLTGNYELFWDGKRIATYYTKDQLHTGTVNSGHSDKWWVEKETGGHNYSRFSPRKKFDGWENWFYIIGWRGPGLNPLDKMIEDLKKHDDLEITWKQIETDNGPQIEHVYKVIAGEEAGTYVRRLFDLNRGCCLVLEETIYKESKFNRELRCKLIKVKGDVWIPSEIVRSMPNVPEGTVGYYQKFVLDQSRCSFNDVSAIPADAFKSRTEEPQQSLKDFFAELKAKQPYGGNDHNAMAVQLRVSEFCLALMSDDHNKALSIMPGLHVPDEVEGFKEMIGTQELTIEAILADNKNVMVVTNIIQNDDRGGVDALIFYMEDSPSDLLIHDIDVGDLDSIKKRIINFQKSHSEARFLSTAGFGSVKLNQQPEPKSKSTVQVEAEINDDTKQKVLNAIESLKHVKFPEIGKGTALVKLQNNQGAAKRIIDFAFKNEFSRSAVYHLKDGQQGFLERAWALGPKGSLMYSDPASALKQSDKSGTLSYGAGTALIQSDKFTVFYRKRDNLHIDFHPDTFLKFSTLNKNYAEALEKIIEKCTDVSVVFSDDNIMHIKAYYESEDLNLDVKFSLDTLKGFLPIHIHYIERHTNDPSKNQNQKYDLQWTNHRGSYYINSFTNEYEVINVSLDASEVKNKISGETISDELIELVNAKRRAKDVIHDKIKLEIVVDKFLPDVEINDIEFSLASFPLPVGTNVRDKISDAQYEIKEKSKPSGTLDSRSEEKPAVQVEGEERALRFPNTLSVGELYIRDEQVGNWYEGWVEFGEAKGEISVPAGQQVKLVISESAASDLSFLNKLSANDVQMLSFGYKKTNVGSLAPIGSMSKLKALNLQSTKFNSEDLSHIAGLKELEVLRLGDHKLSDKSMQYIGEITGLQWLALWGTGISDEGLKHLQNSKDLTFLALNNCNITDEGLSYLKNLTKLEGLQLTQTKISDKGLAELKSFRHLKNLLIMDNGITDAGLEHLKDLSSLEILWINWNPVTDDGLFYLSKLKNLRVLYADRTEITDAGLVHLKGLNDFRQLSISDIGDEGIAYLSELPSLNNLQISDAKVTKASIPYFQNMQSIEKASLSGDKINNTLLEELQAALPACKIWDPQHSRDYPIPAWRKKFDEVYRLEDDQILKRIAPPFIPERLNFYNHEESSQAKTIPEPPAYFTFHWQYDKLKKWGLGFTGGNRSLDSVLRQNLSIESNKFDGPEELMKIQVPGDWIVRMPSTIEGRLRALEKILSDEIGRDIRFEKRQVEEDVIIVTGDFKFHPPTETYENKSVHLYTDKLDPDEGAGGGTSDSVNDFTLMLAGLIDMTVMDQTTVSEEIKVPYRHHGSSYLRKVKNQAEKKIKLDTLLINLTKQTELQFRIERQPIEVWFITEKKKDR